MHIYMLRDLDVKMTDKCTEDRRIVYTHNYERYIESELDYNGLLCLPEIYSCHCVAVIIIINIM